MAICRNITCKCCCQEREVWTSASDQQPEICHQCAAIEADNKKKLALVEIAKLTIEQRLARIEEWIYDYKPQYVPPPRFG